MRLHNINSANKTMIRANLNLFMAQTFINQGTFGGAKNYKEKEKNVKHKISDKMEGGGLDDLFPPPVKLEEKKKKTMKLSYFQEESDKTLE